MQKIFFKYRPVFINAIILFALMVALVYKDGNVKDFFMGIGTGAALISFGYSIMQLKAKEKNTCIADQDN